MSRLTLLSDNLFNPRLYPGHALDASSTATGKDVLFLSSGSRYRELGGWFASALDTAAYVEVVCDQLRAFDMLFLDRDHNLAGKSISVRISDDGFTTYEEIGPLTVPSQPVPFSRLYDETIIMTDEGALVWYIGLHAAHEVRVYVAAMGANLRPELAGIMLGLSWSPERSFIKPDVMGKVTLTHQVQRSPRAQDASGEVGRFWSQVIRLRMSSWEEYLTALWPIEECYGKGRPTLIVPDDERAERASFCRASPGPVGFEVPAGQSLPEIVLAPEEMEPVLL